MKIMIAAALLAAGCATAPPAEAEEVPVRGAGTCDASRAKKLIGRTRSAKLGAEALRLTGATALRWIAPGAMVTMDYRENRLNLRLDRQNKLMKIDCG